MIDYHVLLITISLSLIALLIVWFDIDNKKDDNDQE